MKYYYPTFLIVLLLNHTILGQEVKELDFVIENQYHNTYNTKLEDGTSINFDLTFTDEELGIDICYSMYHGYRFVEGEYTSSKGEKNSLIGLYNFDTLKLYVISDTDLNSSGLRCGMLTRYGDDTKEIAYAEKFQFTGIGFNEWINGTDTMKVDPIDDFKDDLVETSIYIKKGNGEKMDIKYAIKDTHYDFLYPYSELVFQECYEEDNEINLLLVKHNHYSCWNEYESMVQLTFDRSTYELIGNKRYMISKCEKFATDFWGENKEDNKIYNIYSYGFVDGKEKKEEKVGSFSLNKAKVTILEKWM